MTEKTARRIAVALEQLVVVGNSVRQGVFLVADELAMMRGKRGREGRATGPVNGGPVPA